MSMRAIGTIAFMGLRWAFLVLLLVELAVVIVAGENTIDQFTKSFCPDGWWHTSAFWAHCAYPPISISKRGAMYAGYAVFALLFIRMVAPAFKLRLGQLLLCALMVPPAYHLLLVKFSWVETSKLVLVAVVSLVFSYWTLSGRRVQFAATETENKGT